MACLNKVLFSLLLRVSFGLVGSWVLLLLLHAACFTLKTATPFDSYHTPLYIKDIYEKGTYASPPRFHCAVWCGFNTGGAVRRSSITAGVTTADGTLTVGQGVKWASWAYPPVYNQRVGARHLRFPDK